MEAPGFNRSVALFGTPRFFVARRPIYRLLHQSTWLFWWVGLIVFGNVALSVGAASAARFSTANFTVETRDPTLARQFAETAEECRHRLALEWLGRTLPDWAQPCLITAHVGERLGPGGATTFIFDRGEVFGWRMTVQGSARRIMDSVLPHEITHMILATHFRRPLPRWADEGAATSVEHPEERAKYHRMFLDFSRSGRTIPFRTMFELRDYPQDMLPLYAQGFALADFLIEQGGRRKFVTFLEDALDTGRWDQTTAKHYGYASLGDLQRQWLAWVQRGFPRLQPSLPEGPQGFSPVLLTGGKRPRPAPNLIYHIPEPGPAAVPTVVPERDSRVIAAAPLVPVDPSEAPFTSDNPAARSLVVLPGPADRPPLFASVPPSTIGQAEDHPPALTPELPGQSSAGLATPIQLGYPLPRARPQQMILR